MVRFKSFAVTSTIAIVLSLGVAAAQNETPIGGPVDTGQAAPPPANAPPVKAKSSQEKRALPPPAPGQEPAAPADANEEKPEAVEPPPKPPAAKADKKDAPPPARSEEKELKPLPPKPPVNAPGTAPVAGPLSPQERRIAQLSDRIRQELPKQTPPIGVKLLDGTVSRRAVGPGLDLVLHAEGGLLRDRVGLNKFVASTMQNDNYWREWLKNNGVYVSYSNPPVNAADVNVELTPTPEDVAHIDELLELSLDEVELDPSLYGAFIESATFVKPVTGPGRVLQINGRILDEAQRPNLQIALDRAAASLPWWRDNRDDVFLTLDSVVVGSPDRERSRRYFNIALEAFWLGNYREARIAFARALSDDPTSVVLQYWRVLNHVALGEEERARRKLVPLLRSDPWGSNGPLVAVAFERVQGPLRWRLRELEQEVLLTTLP